MPNKVILTEKDKETVLEGKKLEGLSVSFLENSDNNTVKIISPYYFHSFSIVIAGNNNTIEIGANSHIRSTMIVMTVPSDNRTLVIGKNFDFMGGRLDLTSDNNRGIIGDDCIFSSNITMTTEDGHPIYDIHSKKLLNKGGSFTVGNHVWLGYNTTVCKDVEIASNVIIGACSVVTKSIKEENCIAAGSPAKIVKRNVDFSKLLISSYEKQKNNKEDENKNGK